MSTDSKSQNRGIDNAIAPFTPTPTFPSWKKAPFRRRPTKEIRFPEPEVFLAPEVDRSATENPTNVCPSAYLPPKLKATQADSHYEIATPIPKAKRRMFRRRNTEECLKIFGVCLVVYCVGAFVLALHHDLQMRVMQIEQEQKREKETCLVNFQNNCEVYRPALVEDCKSWKLCLDGFVDTEGRLASGASILAEAINALVDTLSVKGFILTGILVVMLLLKKL